MIVVANQATLLSEHFTLTDLKRLIANLARAKATNRILGMGSVRSSALRMPTVNWAQLHWPIVSANPISMQALIATAGNLIKCILCTFEGLDCRGGFENQTNHTATSGPGVHALPIAQFLSCTQNDACLPIFSHCVITRD